MAQPQLPLNPFSGSGKESFREFELLLRSILAVAALPANQQANSLQSNLRDAAFFQILPMATRQNLELSITALRDRFCNPHLQDLHVLKHENMKFDSKTDTLENFLVTLQRKATKAYPDPDPPAVAPSDPYAADAAVEQTRFDQDTARRAEIIPFAQEARSVQIRRQFIKNMPGWLRAKLLEQPQNTTVEDLCFFARKQLSIHNLCKTDDSIMDAFSEMGPSVTDTLVTALTKLSTSQGAMDNRLTEMSTRFEERNTTLTNQFNNFQKNQTQQPQRGSFSQNRGQTSNSSKVIIAELLEAASAVILEDSEDLDRIIHDLNGKIRTKIQIRHDNSHIKTFRSKIQIPFFSRNRPLSNLRITTFKINILKIKTHSLRIQIFNRNHRLKSLLPQILITCLIHNKLRLLVINVAILIT